MPIHVAILQRAYAELVLSGRKTIESRLMAGAVPPWGKVQPGDRLFVKVSGGPFVATAVAGAVDSFDQLNVAKLRELYRRYNKAVCGTAAYWRAKRNSRYGLFIHLRDVEPIDAGPDYEKNAWRAWFVLPDAASPLRQWTLTDGAIRNRYVRVPGDWAGFFPEGRFTLLLPDGRQVVTDVNHRGLIRWRGWGSYYAQGSLKPGDRIRFVRLPDRRYRVTWIAT